MNVSQWLDKWLEVYKVRACRPKTIEGYRVLIEHAAAAIGGVELDQLTPEDVQSAINAQLDAGNERQAQALFVLLDQALKRAIKSRIIAANPCDLLDKPRHEQQHGRAISAEELAQLLPDAQASPYWTAIALALYAGLRRGEVAALRWSDVDLQEGILRIRSTLVRVDHQLQIGPPKSAAGVRCVPIAADLAPVLRAARRAQPFGRVCPFAPETIGRAWKRVQIAAGGDPVYTFHDLRHTCATRWINRGMIPKHAQYLLGHASLSLTVDLYAHHDFSAIREDFARIDSFIDGTEKRSHDWKSCVR